LFAWVFGPDCFPIFSRVFPASFCPSLFLRFYLGSTFDRVAPFTTCSNLSLLDVLILPMSFTQRHIRDSLFPTGTPCPIWSDPQFPVLFLMLWRSTSPLSSDFGIPIFFFPSLFSANTTRAVCVFRLLYVPPPLPRMTEFEACQEPFWFSLSIFPVFCRPTPAPP